MHRNVSQGEMKEGSVVLPATAFGGCNCACVPLVIQLTWVGSGGREGCQRAATLPCQHGAVRLPVLFVHDHVDYRVDASRQIEQQIAENVKSCKKKKKHYIKIEIW